MAGLAERTTRAAQWRLTGSVLGAACQLTVGVLLARLLAPGDFGAVALALIVLGVAQPLGELGIGSALVQRALLSDRHVRVAFTCSLAAGVAMTALVACSASTIAAVLGSAALAPVLGVLSVTFAVRGAGVVAEALLRRELDFKRHFVIESSSYAIGYGCVAVALAVRGHGVWSLVWGGIIQTTLTSAAQLAVTRHAMRPLLARRELIDLLHVGAGTTLSGLVSYIALNGDNFVVGRWLGAASLGLYGRAYALMNLPYTYAAGAITGVLFPAFAQVQGEPARLRRGYLLSTQLTAMIAGPAMVTLAIAAPHAVPALYGEQWEGVVTPLQILCVAGYFRCLYHLGGVVIRSVGRVYAESLVQMGYAALVIGGTMLASRHGLPWVAVAVSAAILFMFVATGHLALRAARTGWGDYLRVQRGAIATSAAAGTVAMGARALLEGGEASTVAVAVGVVAAALAPWSIGFLWQLEQPGFEPLRARLSAACARYVGPSPRHAAIARRVESNASSSHGI